MTAADPIRDDELEALFAPLAGEEAIGLAVSGGADSTALMVLAARWAGRCSDAPRLIVLTVDHGLRPESAGEAVKVAKLARRLGLGHETLSWTGDKPTANLQAAAREARYRLLIERAVLSGLGAIVVAHHLEDQAETVLMRLARGSGVDGLAAMAPARWIGGIRLVRPLLDVPKARLVATLETAGIGWIEDPSNENTAFERIRLRRLLPVLAGEGLTPERLAATARRMRKASDALEADALSRLAAFARFHPGGFGALDPAAFADCPEEIALRLVARLLTAVGGTVYPPRQERLEALVEAIRSRDDGRRLKRTLAGVVVEARRGRLWFYREAGREGMPEIPLLPGEKAIWDHRFKVTLAAGAGTPVVVGPLGPDGRAVLGLTSAEGMPAAALETMPAAFAAGRLAAVPAFSATLPDAASAVPFSAVWEEPRGLRLRSFTGDIPGGVFRASD
ncbi:tRNA(Ile)-lysidine synthase [Rhodobium orientis]|uniref:tRNA(Ile)-lysidine synthase n=1 Tax=Rhodobium orientis TaxID=34017 RepID=A0A327JSW6_9HYPH|nr:tRNA lysidine(34) synthetase TilS [Rhodobium orientis]MBB4303021.1 tRNA(Ile)-lysidine synthase [Rhodobium orientis]MBK5949580.1 tRNA lysidine(34) synthetase TilS [Rhodobium orientis]RAI29367.1 tRNA lysidine(34) synthetase TilS [Rhodobium orientis]